MISRALEIAMLSLFAFHAFAYGREELKAYRAGERGIARIAVKLAMIAGWLIGAVAVFRYLVPDNPVAALTIWILGMIVVIRAWAELDERLERWERS